MVGTSPVDALQLAGSLIEVPILGGAAVILRKIARCCEDVPVHKRKTARLANKCAQLLSTLREQSSTLAGTDLQNRVDELTAIYETIETRIRPWLRYNRVTAFFKCREIQRGIELCERELAHATAQFQNNAAINMNERYNGSTQAQEIQQRNEIRDLLHQVLANHGGDLQEVMDIQGQGGGATERTVSAGERELQASRENTSGKDKTGVIRNGVTALYRLTEIPPDVKILNGEIARTDHLAIVGGTYSDVWQGVTSLGEKVALKTLRNIKVAGPQAWKSILNEMNVWAGLHHNHILPFYGVVTDQGPHFQMVSPWQENGNAIDFARRTLDVNKIHLLSGAAKGLNYLHSCGITHGKVKCSNILVSQTGEARICDFGMTKAIEALTSENNAAALSIAAGGARWLAPELIYGSVTSPTKESDTYSYAMAILELLTGKHPFPERRREASAIHDVIVLGKIPRRPTGTEVLPWLTDDLWGLMTTCWARPASSRPPMNQVSALIQEMDGFTSLDMTDLRSSRRVANDMPQPASSPEPIVPLSPHDRKSLSEEFTGQQGTKASLNVDSTHVPANAELVAKLESIFADLKKYRALLAHRDSTAQGLLDMFQRLLDVLETSPSNFRRDLIVATQRLAGASGLYPSSYELPGVTILGDEPESSGGFANVYKGSFQDRLVCVKTIRLNGKTKIRRFLKACSKEAILWGQLLHPNILPFYGIHRTGDYVSLVSPWMDHGDINKYLKEEPSADRVLLASDVARGLQFLHESRIIHGDLKGPNILINEFGRACLADFGISSVSDPAVLAWSSHSAVASKGGSVRWQAPELFDPAADEDVHNTTASDVYAWSCVTYEIFTGDVPFAHLLRGTAVMLKIMSGEKPVRPPETSLAWNAWGLTENIWSLMQDCWMTNPTERPTVGQIIERLLPDLREDLQVDQPGGAISPARFRQMVLEGPTSPDDALSIHTLERLLNSPTSQ